MRAKSEFLFNGLRSDSRRALLESSANSFFLRARTAWITRKQIERPRRETEHIEADGSIFCCVPVLCARHVTRERRSCRVRVLCEVCGRGKWSNACKAAARANKRPRATLRGDLSILLFYFQWLRLARTHTRTQMPTLRKCGDALIGSLTDWSSANVKNNKLQDELVFDWSLSLRTMYLLHNFLFSFT